LGVSLLLALVAAGGVSLRMVRSGSPTSAAHGTKVVVVLPFKNLGPVAEQYFADGLTEELTSRLAGLSGLRVISRTSADQYRASPKSLRTIGAELGAGYVLEGSVRWERNAAGQPGRIRVTPQLIAVTDDSHLWSQVYESELTEVFAVQSQIAEQVTAALDVALRGTERAALARGGTRSAEAYDLYLRGNEYFGRSYDRNDLLGAVELYQKAVTLDSGFAPALARLSRAHAAMYWFYHDRSRSRLAEAKRAVDAALAVAPDLAESHIALGYYNYWGERSFDRALREFESVRATQPNNGDLQHAIGYVQRRLGRWDEATASLEEARRYDPRSPVTTLDLADVYVNRRRYADGEPLIERAIQLAPDWASPYANKAMLYLVWRGDLQRSRAVMGQALARVGPGRLAQALTIADGISASLLTADTVFRPAVDAVTVEAFEGDRARYYMFKAEAAGFRGLRESERAYADSARRLLEVRARHLPDDAKVTVRLGQAYARLGLTEQAIAAGRRATSLTPVSADANSGPFIATHLAEIYMMVGDTAQAVATLEPLLRVASWISPAELRADPLWAPLRAHPRFRVIAEMR
jgi:TolB-like protein/Flp pilus assembly protein TadD